MTITRAQRAPHTWTQCPGAAFHVRQGPNYAVTGKKARSPVEKASRAWPASAARAAVMGRGWPELGAARGVLRRCKHRPTESQPAGWPEGGAGLEPVRFSSQAASAAPLYEVVACDAFTSETKLSHLARVMALPDETHCSDLPPLLIINFMIPNYTPSGTMATRTRTRTLALALTLTLTLTLTLALALALTPCRSSSSSSTTASSPSSPPSARCTWCPRGKRATRWTWCCSSPRYARWSAGSSPSR